MKILLVLAFAALAAGTVLRPTGHEMEEIDLLDGLDEFDPEDDTSNVAPQFIISWQLRRFIKKLQKQMPCGFEQYGIPPLAPLKISEASIDLERGFLHTIDEIFRFRVDGLDKFKINKLKINLITSKIKFDFNFKSLTANAAKYDTDTIVDALRQLGLSVEYEGGGTLDFGLVNLRIAGTIKYKIPVLWGSIKVKSLRATVTLEKVNSDINGLMGHGKLNRIINNQLETLIESGINDNQETITNKIEDTLVPRINKVLKGNNFWTILDSILSSSDGEKEDDPIVTKCVAPTDPWA